MSEKSSIAIQVQITLTEEEARALEALGGYGDDALIKAFYNKMGQHYLGPHEEGMRSLLKSTRQFLPQILSKADAARKVFSEP